MSPSVGVFHNRVPMPNRHTSCWSIPHPVRAAYACGRYGGGTRGRHTYGLRPSIRSPFNVEATSQRDLYQSLHPHSSFLVATSWPLCASNSPPLTAIRACSLSSHSHQNGTS